MYVYIYIEREREREHTYEVHQLKIGSWAVDKIYLKMSGAFV